MRKSVMAAAAIASFMFHAGANAGSYQFEGGLVYVDVDAGFFSDSALGIDGTFHFDPVDSAGLPLAEAPFMRRASNVSASYITTDESEVDTLSGGIELFLEQVYLAAEVDSVSNGIDSTDLSARAGLFIADHTLLYLGYANEDAADLTALSLGLKSVTKMVGDTALNIELELAKFDDDDDTLVLSGLIDYHFNPMFSAGVRIIESDADNDDTAVGVGARFFFTETVSGEIEYLTQDETDTFGLRLAARF